MRWDEATGRPIPSRASALRCRVCHRPFAAGYLPTDGGDVCRDCRAEAAVPADDAPRLRLMRGGAE